MRPSMRRRAHGGLVRAEAFAISLISIGRRLSPCAAGPIIEGRAFRARPRGMGPG